MYMCVYVAYKTFRSLFETIGGFPIADSRGQTLADTFPDIDKLQVVADIMRPLHFA